MVERLYRPREVAEMLGVTQKTAQRLMREQMRCYDLGSPNAKKKSLAVTMPEIERWQAERVLEPSTEQVISIPPKARKQIPKRLHQSVPDRIPRRKYGQ